jgi:hypothetical protein
MHWACVGPSGNDPSSIASVMRCLPAITPHPTLLVSGQAYCKRTVPSHEHTSAVMELGGSQCVVVRAVQHFDCAGVRKHGAQRRACNKDVATRMKSAATAREPWLGTVVE